MNCITRRRRRPVPSGSRRQRTESALSRLRRRWRTNGLTRRTAYILSAERWLTWTTRRMSIRQRRNLESDRSCRFGPGTARFRRTLARSRQILAETRHLQAVHGAAALGSFTEANRSRNVLASR